MIRSKNELPWIVLGDFNLLRSLEDTTAESPNINTMIHFNNLIDERGSAARTSFHLVKQEAGADIL